MKRSKVRKALLNKLDCAEREGTEHTKYRFMESDKCIAVTALPRDKEIRDKLFGRIARQLFISFPQFRGIVVCTYERDDYIQMLKKSQLLLERAPGNVRDFVASL
jgi:hypothetical protein